jgi:hypothetical protein
MLVFFVVGGVGVKGMLVSNGARGGRKEAFVVDRECCREAVVG